MKRIYKLCVSIGQISGCHQRADRSFFICGKQFPVCSRCTGVFIGEIVAIGSFRFISAPIPLLICFCAVMFTDWFIQYLGIKESTNKRRLATGLLGGYGYFALVLNGLFSLKNYISIVR